MFPPGLPLATVLAVVFLVPTASQAATVSLATSPSSDVTQVYRAGLGETNDLTVSYDGSVHGNVFADSGAFITAGPGCTAVAADATCPVHSGVSLLDVLLRDGNDRANVVVSGLAAHVSGGPGDDSLVADSQGRNTEVDGDGGDDTVQAGGESHAVADGGGGNDTVTTFPFAGVGTGIGGSGSDLMFFKHALPAAAELDGGAGADTIVAQPGGRSGSTAVGGDGNDVIAVHGSEPTNANAEASTFTITGGMGDDTIFGGPADDTIDGGPGRDVIDAAGGGSDTVTCGDGVDVVRYDASDQVAADCEVRLAP